MADTSKDEIPDIRRRDVFVDVTCANCVFFRRHAVYAKPCETFGTAPAAKTCSRFVPDPVQMDRPDGLGPALGTLASIKKAGLAYMAVTSGASRVRKLGFRVGQRVFFKVMGSDFLGNYAQGIVVGAAGDRLIVSGAESFTAFLQVRHLFDDEAFLKKKRRLVSLGRVNDPGVRLERIAIRDKKLLLAHVPMLAGAVKKRGRGRPPGKKPAKNTPIIIGR